jgi:serine/threonine protein kinase
LTRSVAHDNLTNESVAIKKYTSIFSFEDVENTTESPTIEQQKVDIHTQKRILMDIKAMTHLAGHPNILQLKGTVQPLSYRRFQDVYVITDLMDAVRISNTLLNVPRIYVT